MGVDLFSEFKIAESAVEGVVRFFIGSVTGKSGFEAGIEESFSESIPVLGIALALAFPVPQLLTPAPEPG